MFSSEHELRERGEWHEAAQTKTETICSYCGVGCTLTLHVQDNEIVKVTSPIENDVTSGHLCIKGRFGYTYVQNRPRRGRLMALARAGRSTEAEVTSLAGDVRSRKHDHVVTEEPLEIRLVCGDVARTLAVTMRTPGNDFELAAGFLYGEGLIRSRNEIAELTYCLDPAIDPEQRYNVVSLELRSASQPLDLTRFERHFTMNSSCGVCGRAQLDSLRDRGVKALDDDVRIEARTLYSLPERMRAAQRVFDSTGGLHAAALFDERGEAIAVREDVGRHNAVDKLVGWGLLEARLPFARFDARRERPSEL